jgi:hypothetical protein
LMRYVSSLEALTRTPPLLLCLEHS